MVFYRSAQGVDIFALALERVFSRLGYFGKPSGAFSAAGPGHVAAPPARAQNAQNHTRRLMYAVPWFGLLSILKIRFDVDLF